MVSVDVKHHVYLLTYLHINMIDDYNVSYNDIYDKVPKGVQGKWTEVVEKKRVTNVRMRYAFFGRTYSKSALCERTRQCCQ